MAKKTILKNEKRLQQKSNIFSTYDKFPMHVDYTPHRKIQKGGCTMTEGKKDLAAVKSDVLTMIEKTQAQLQRLENLLSAIEEQESHSAK